MGNIDKFSSPDNCKLAIVINLGGGWLPPGDCYSVRLWAAHFGKTEATVRKAIRDNNVPTLMVCGEMYVHGHDFQRFLPHEEAPDGEAAGQQ